MWFLHQRVLLTKDNLLKRNWHGSKKCCHSYQDETIQHLFIDCPLAKIVWRIVHQSFSISISPPKNIKNLFGNWLAGVTKKVKAQIRVGACAYCGLYGMSGMIIYLTGQNKILLCRLSHWLLIGSVRGPYYNQQRSERRWLLGAAAWSWWHGIYTTCPAGVLIWDWHVET
jgi:hypothetical protein